MFANADMSDYFRMSPMDLWDLDSSEGILDASGLPVRLSGPGSAGSDTGLGADLGVDPVEQADLQRVLDKENRQMEVDALRDDPKALQEFLISKGHTEIGDADGIIGKNTRKGIDNYINGFEPSEITISFAEPRKVQEKVYSDSFDAGTKDYTVLTGKYGTLHDYGDYIVNPNIDDIVNSSSILSKYGQTRQCFALVEGFSNLYTGSIAAGRPLLDFGGDIPHGTLFATFVPDKNGTLVYPSDHNGLYSKKPAPGKYSGHVFAYDAKSGGLIKVDGKVTGVNVIEQYSSLPKVTQQPIINSNADTYRLYKNLGSYYAITQNKP